MMGATELKTIRVRYSIPGAAGVRKVVIWHAIVFFLPKIYVICKYEYLRLAGGP